MFETNTIEFAKNTKEHTRFLADGRFRIRVVRESNRLIAIHYETYHKDTDTWGTAGKTIRLPREEIQAAAELLKMC